MTQAIGLQYPVLPLRDIVVFPGVTIPLWVARTKSIRALDRALAENSSIFLVAQRSHSTEDPRESDLYAVGTLAAVTDRASSPNGSTRLLVQGLQRGRLRRIGPATDCIEGEVELLDDPAGDATELHQITETMLARAQQHEDQVLGSGPPTAHELGKETDARVARMQAVLEAETPTLAERLRLLLEL